MISFADPMLIAKLGDRHDAVPSQLDCVDCGNRTYPVELDQHGPKHGGLGWLWPCARWNARVILPTSRWEEETIIGSANPSVRFLAGNVNRIILPAVSRFAAFLQSSA